MKKENKVIKERIIRDIRNLFEQEKKYYCKLLRVGNFGSEIILNMEAMEIEIRHYQLKN